MQSKTAQIVAGRTNRRTLDVLLNEVLVYIESALNLDAELHPQHPPCACGCGETNNLKPGHAGGNKIWLCPDAAREANHPKM